MRQNPGGLGGSLEEESCCQVVLDPEEPIPAGSEGGAVTEVVGGGTGVEGVGWGTEGDSFCVHPGMFPRTQAPGLVCFTTQATPGPSGMGPSAVEPRDVP